MKERSGIFSLHSCQTCTIKSLQSRFEWLNVKGYLQGTHALFLYANLYVIDLSEGCQGEKCFSAAFLFFPSLKTCSYPSNDPCRWDTNSNVGRHSWPHRLGSICRGSCGQIRPKLYRVFRQRPTVRSRLSSSVFSCSDLQTGCHIW